MDVKKVGEVFYHVLKQVKPSSLALLCSMGEAASHYKVTSSAEFG